MTHSRNSLNEVRRSVDEVSERETKGNEEVDRENERDARDTLKKR